MPVDKSSDRVRRMFGQIAGRYDFLNHLLSLGIDHYWRWRTVRLRAAGGAAADSRRLHRHRRLGAGVRPRGRRPDARSWPPTSATRCWRSAGRKRPSRAPTARITFLEADAQSLPLPTDAFQIVCVAFGLRNVADTDRGLAEMTRVAAPGGRVAVLEFSTPTLAAVQGDLRLVLPPRPAADRPVLRAQFGRRLRVPARERRRVSAGRSARRADARRRPRRRPLLSAHFRRGYTLCREES